MTQTPASGPLSLVTTPAMSSASIAMSAGCAACPSASRAAPSAASMINADKYRSRFAMTPPYSARAKPARTARLDDPAPVDTRRGYRSTEITPKRAEKRRKALRETAASFASLLRTQPAATAAARRPAAVRQIVALELDTLDCFAKYRKRSTSAEEQRKCARHRPPARRTPRPAQWLPTTLPTARSDSTRPPERCGATAKRFHCRPAHSMHWSTSSSIATGWSARTS